MELTTKRVLVVEDDPALLRLVSEFLRARGLEVRAVRTGRAALEQMRAQPFDLLLVDLTLPDISGFDLMEQAPHYPGLSGAPLLVMSARTSPIDQAQAIELGASDFLAKPFTLAELGARIDALLASHPPRLPEAKQRQAV